MISSLPPFKFVAATNFKEISIEHGVKYELD